jgi:S-adenosylmethionine:tRNA ribosyltransferase-isomerase
MKANKLDIIIASTQIMIAPGYHFKFVDGLLTNFHQPQSTLLLLVSAFVGTDWREIYNFAMQNEFRFLSYGDSSLLWRKSCHQ